MQGLDWKCWRAYEAWNEDEQNDGDDEQQPLLMVTLKSRVRLKIVTLDDGQDDEPNDDEQLQL